MSEHANKPEQSRPEEQLGHGGDKSGLPLTPEEAKAKREKRIMAVMIILAVVLALAASVVLLYNRWFRKPILPPDPNLPDSSAPPEPRESGDVAPDIDAVQPKVSGDRRSKDIFTILVFGTDIASGLTDTMMVATYDVTNQRATVMSLPRDTLVNVRWSNKCLNTVYSAYSGGEQGVEALKNEVSELVGFVPDFYVKIDWELVGEMVEAIGGVWFDNPYHMEYYDPYQDLNIYQEQGYRKLNGNDAMQVVRWRHNNPGVPYKPGVSRAYAASDLERLGVQQAFLKAVLKQTLQIQNLAKITQLADLFGRRVESDLAVEEILWFGKAAVFGGLGVDDVEFFTMPCYGVERREALYYGRVYPNQTQLLKVINEKLNPFVEEVTIKELDLIRVIEDGDALASSTGRLADPSAAIPPVKETDPPEESDPVESGEPQESDPAATDPADADPDPDYTGGLPPETGPEGPDVPAGTGGDPVPPPAAGGEPESGDWGSTPD